MMSDLWKSPVSRDVKDVSRDFIHLSQARYTDGTDKVADCKYYIAVILENCPENKKYKDTAVANLVSMADDEIIKESLEFYASYKDYIGQKIAQEILEKMSQCELKGSDREASVKDDSFTLGCSLV